jgi:hypothetical protein
MTIVEYRALDITEKYTQGERWKKTKMRMEEKKSCDRLEEPSESRVM